MNHKVLLADDSLTIQKVIKITLANQPYDITDCSSEDELFQKLPLVQPKIVFLDFNLSEKFTGYELTSKIKSVSPSTKVLLLLGTFDSVDDASLEKCGASDKIVKPFDSNKFIAICKQLAESDGASEDLAYPEIRPEPELSADPDDQWTMATSKDMSLEQPVIETPKQEEVLPVNALDREISDWGMSVPGIINDKASHDIMIDLPPVIGTVSPAGKENPSKKAAAPVPASDAVYPSNDDLDYPDMGTSGPAQSEPAKNSAASKLLSIETFNEQPEIELEKFPAGGEESDVSSIEAQIRDEVEDDLWKADEFEDLKREVSDKISSIKSDFQPTMNDFDEALFKPLDEHETIKWSNEEPDEVSHSAPTTGVPAASLDQLRSEMEAMVKRYVQEYMDQMFKQNVEKVSWEVIPDLAENLIRQELSKISNKIINDQ